MGACASSPTTLPVLPNTADFACSTPRKAPDPCSKGAVQESDPEIQARPADEHSAAPVEQRASRESVELQAQYHDSAGSLPADQRGSLLPDHQTVTDLAMTSRQHGAGPVAAAAPPAAAGCRPSLGAMPEGGVAYKPYITFSSHVPPSPFEAGIAARAARQPPLRHSVDIAIPRQASVTLDDSAFRRESQSSRRHSISAAPSSQLRAGLRVSEIEQTNKAGLDRIMRLSASVFRTDSVLLHLRDGDRVVARDEDVAFSDGVRAAACRALQPPDGGTAVVDDPASDPRLEGEEEVRAAVRYFAGTPLMASNGYRLGSLVLLHSKPYMLDAINTTILKNMAELMAREVWGAYEHKHEQQILQLTKVADCYSEPHLLVEVSDLEPWSILRINQAAVRVTGMARVSVTKKPFWEVFRGFDNSSNMKRSAVSTRASQGCSFNLTNMIAVKAAVPVDSEDVTFTCTFRPAARDVTAEDSKARSISNAGRYYYFVGLRVEATTPVTSCVDRTPMPGLVLGQILGSGAFGRVYKGYYRGQVVAVKVCNSCNLRCDANGVPMEASLIGQLQHPHLVRTLETAKAVRDRGGPQRSPSLGQGGPASAAVRAALQATPLECANSARLMEETWLLLEYCDMGSLMDAINKSWFRSCAKGPANVRIVLLTAHEMASGLAFLHTQGLVHGDLSSGNVLLSSSPDSPHGFSVKISDFGLSRKMDIQSRIETKTTGTVNYMPPEVLSDGIVSKAADVYAFGVLLWEMVCGQRAWEGLTPPQVMLAVACQHKQLQFPNWAPQEITKLCYECMDADPQRRPTFAEAERRLAKLLGKLQGADSMDLQHFRALSCP